MIVLQVTGGLGNQMFQFAFARIAALKCDTKVALDLSFYDINNKPHEVFKLQIFQNADYKVASRRRIFFYNRKTLCRSGLLLDWIKTLQGYNIIREGGFEYDSSYMKSLKKNSYLIGHWQSGKYINNNELYIKSLFKFPDLRIKNREFIMEHINNETVSVHIRRGDYLMDNDVNEKQGVLSLTYYLEAINFIQTKIEHPFFIFFSDDPEWVRTTFDLKDSIVVDWNKQEYAYEDMCLMSNCKHNIIANSSFSWWGAWLNNHPSKIVIAPQNPFLCKGWNTRDYYPEQWHMI